MNEKVRVNWHGVLGVALVLAAVGIAFVRRWDVPWLYFLAAIVGYVVAVLALTFALRGSRGQYAELDSFDLMRVMYGAHLGFLFLVGGLLIPFGSFWVGLGVF
ncbi:hypothetical protein BC739_009050, partial [Kutzneria viridogrisea]|nr:hypothetical protein [Kutzneria viridogrisea]